MFTLASSIARKLSLAIVVALLGSLQVSIASATTPVPEDGYYDCETGVKRADSDWRGFRIVDSNVYNINCTGEVVLPDGLTSVGDYAFSGSKLTSIIIPSSVTSIGSYSFYDSALESLTIPSSVTSIGYNAFYNAKALTSIEIPSSVTTISESAFQGAASLTSIVIPEGVTTIENNTFLGATSLESVTIPSSVTSIGDCAFFNTKALTSITIPSSVTSILARAFYGASSLTSITIPSSVASIGSNVFNGTSSLTSITVEAGNPNYASVDGVLLNKSETTLMQYPIGSNRSSYTVPSSVKKLGSYSFSGATALSSIVIPVGVTSIDEGVFEEATSLNSVNIPEGVKYIGDEAFSDATSLSSITIPSTVTSIGDYAFYGTTSLASITVPSGVTKIGYGAFSSSALTSIIIPDGVTSIYESTFGYTSALTSVTIPASVTYIDYYAFASATALTSISIPASVTTIEQGAFDGASSLKDVYFLGNAPTNVGEGAFSNIAAGAKAHISYSATGFGSEPTWNGLTIKRAAPVYTVTFNSKGGSSVPADSFVNDGSLAIPYDPTREGYTFLGWSATDGGSAITFPYTPGVTEDITLYALWSAESHTVTFNSKEGSSVADGYFDTDDYLAEPTPPTRAGYTFLGWSDTDGGSAVSFPYAPDVTTDITLYALWSANSHTVTFDSKGGSSVTNGSFVTDGSVTAPTAPTLAGYTFSGWRTTAEYIINEGPVSFPYAPGVIEGITLYAVWSANSHTVTFDSKGGSSVDAGVFVTDGYIESPHSNPGRAGYTFLGWSDSDGGSLLSFPYAPGVMKDVTLYALWSADSHTAFFMSQGAYIYYLSYVTDGSLEKPADPVRTGYTFGGWSLTEDGSAVSFPYAPGLMEPITLFAKWSLTNYSVTFNSKGGTTVAAGSFVYGGAVATAPRNPYRSGAIFAGWSDTDGGSAISFPYYPGTDSNVTLYARWTILAPLLSTASATTLLPGDLVTIKVSRVNSGCTVTVGWREENSGVSSISTVIRPDRSTGVFSIATPSTVGRYTLTTNTIGSECSSGAAITLAKSFVVGKAASVVAKVSSSSAFVSKNPTVSVTGTVKSAGVVVASKEVTVSLRRNGVEVATASVTTNSAGVFSLSLPNGSYVAGDYTAVVTLAADSTYRQTQVTTSKITLR